MTSDCNAGHHSSVALGAGSVRGISLLSSRPRVSAVSETTHSTTPSVGVSTTSILRLDAILGTLCRRFPSFARARFSDTTGPAPFCLYSSPPGFFLRRSDRSRPNTILCAACPSVSATIHMACARSRELSTALHAYDRPWLNAMIRETTQTLVSSASIAFCLLIIAIVA